MTRIKDDATDYRKQPPYILALVLILLGLVVGGCFAYTIDFVHVISLTPSTAAAQAELASLKQSSSADVNKLAAAQAELASLKQASSADVNKLAAAQAELASLKQASSANTHAPKTYLDRPQGDPTASVSTTVAPTKLEAITVVQPTMLSVNSTDSATVGALKQPTVSETAKRALCSRSGLNYWMKCRAAIVEGLALRNATCPQKCVTFEAYGRFNNNIRQLVHAYTRFGSHNRVGDASRYSIVLSGFFKEKMDGFMDFDELAKTCIFPSWSVEGRTQHRTKCTQLDATNLYYSRQQQLQRKANASPTVGGGDGDDTGLIKAWLLYGAVAENVQRQTTEYVSQFHADFSTVHARFLEGSCTVRHENEGMPSDICQFKPDYIALMLAKLGHTSQGLIFCSDKQQRDLVTKVVAHTHGVISKNVNPLLDTLLMILSKRFLGNAVSTMSMNVHEIRNTIFHSDAIDAIV